MLRAVRETWKPPAIVLSSLAASSLLAFAFRPILHDKAQLLPFTLAVMAASWYGGLAPGLITTLLSFAIADFFFIEPLYQVLSLPGDYALLVVFLMFGFSLSILNHALKRVNQRIEQTSRELARSNEDLERFAHSVAHDLKEPLRGIQVFTELFLESNRARLDSESARLLEFVKQSAGRMRALIDGILEFATAGNSASSARVDTAAMVQAAVDQLRGRIGESGARLSVDPLPAVRGNAEQLQRLFLNLIGNALKYHGASPPEIRISAVQKEGEWQFAVRDNGIGIDPKYQQQVFEIFTRLHSSSEYEGCGVGLATCRRIVQQHGGRIWVESQEGGGSAFYFTLPRS